MKSQHGNGRFVPVDHSRFVGAQIGMPEPVLVTSAADKVLARDDGFSFYIGHSHEMTLANYHDSRDVVRARILYGERDNAGGGSLLKSQNPH